MSIFLVIVTQSKGMSKALFNGHLHTVEGSLILIFSCRRRVLPCFWNLSSNLSQRRIFISLWHFNYWNSPSKIQRKWKNDFTPLEYFCYIVSVKNLKSQLKLCSASFCLDWRSWCPSSFSTSMGDFDIDHSKAQVQFHELIKSHNFLLLLELLKYPKHKHITGIHHHHHREKKHSSPL